MKKLLIIYLLMLQIVLADSSNYNLEFPKEDKYISSSTNSLKSRGNWDRLGNQTASAGLLSLGTLGILYAMPADITGWDDEEGGIENLGEKWVDHITTGPQWDHDRSFFNWIGHPYVGAAYYMAARKSDFNQFDSFIYSAVMSSFFWEYGIEAFAEVPSVQDLIITPVLGSFLGEAFFIEEQRILKNDGRFLGSKFLGKTTLIVMDPIGTLAKIMGFKDDYVMGNWNVLLDENSGNFTGLSLSIGGTL